MPEDLLIVVSSALFYFVFNYILIKRSNKIKKYSIDNMIFLGILLALNAAYFILRFLNLFDNYILFAIVVILIAAFNFIYGKISINLLIYETVLLLSILSILVINFRTYLIFFLPVSFVIIILTMSSFYGYLVFEKNDVLSSFFAVLLFVSALDSVFIRYLINLPGRISFILLLLGLFHARGNKYFNYIISDDKLKKYLIITIPLILIQDIVLLIIFKNPIFH